MEQPQRVETDAMEAESHVGSPREGAGQATQETVVREGGTRLIVFLVPPAKDITGGLLSIFSIAKTTRDLFDVHGSTVELCVYPGFESYGHNELFDNDEWVLTLDEIVARGVPDYLQLHVPVDASDAILNGLESYQEFLEAVPHLSVNLLNQNIRLMPTPSAGARWYALTPHVTQTTAHDRYSTQEVADLYSIPLTHLSAYLDPGQYERRRWADKSDIILLSIDAHPAKERIVDRLARDLPDFELVTLIDLTYWDYKDLIARAKYCITFGEGFDGYYLEPIFSGSVSFTVYNEDFFPHQGFAEFPNVYESYDEMAEHIVSDMRRLDDEGAYEGVVEQNFAELAKYYDYATYVDNIRRFFLGEVTFHPGEGSATHLLGITAAALAAETARHNASVHDLHTQLIEVHRLFEIQLADSRSAEQQLLVEVEHLRAERERLEASRMMRYSKSLRHAYSQLRTRVFGFDE